MALAGPAQRRTRCDARGARRSAGALAGVDESGDAGIWNTSGGYLLDARSAVLRHQAPGARHQSGKPVAAAGCGDDAGSEFASGLPLWRNVLKSTGTARSRTARPCGEIIAARTEGKSGVLAAVSGSGKHLLPGVERLRESRRGIPRGKQEPELRRVDEDHGRTFPGKRRVEGDGSAVVDRGTGVKHRSLDQRERAHQYGIIKGR